MEENKNVKANPLRIKCRNGEPYKGYLWQYL